ncbi:MAG: tetratricopeptide repeat protein [Microcoleaceae cyanobacterium]
MSVEARYPAWKYLEIVQELENEEKWTEAIDLCKEAVRFYPNDSDILCSLAVIQDKQGDAEAAVISYQQLVKSDLKQPIWVYLSLGNLLVEQERFDESIAICQTAKSLYSKNLKIHQLLGSVAEKKGDSSQAIESYYRVIEINPQRPTWLYLSLGSLLVEQEKFDESIAVY